MFRLIHATLVHPSLCLPHSSPTVTVTVTIAPVSLLLLAGWIEDVVQVLIASTYDYIWSTCLGLFSTWMLVIIYLQCPSYLKLHV